MSQQALGDKLTEWAIGACRAFATLPFDLQIVPFASSEEAASERLIVTCEVGEKIQSGLQPYECKMTFEFRTVNRSAEEANDVFAKVEAVLFSSLNNAGSVALATSIGLTYLQAFPESAETNLEGGGNFRKYTRTIPLRAM